MGKEKRERNINKDIAGSDYSELYLKIIKSGIYLALFLPLLVIPGFLYPFQFGKVIIFRVIVELILLFYIFLIIKKSEYRPRWGLIEIAVTIFTAIFFLTSITGVNFLRSFWGTSERMGGFFSFVHYWIFFIIATNIFRSRDEWKKLFSVSVFAAIISSVYAIGQSIYFTDFLNWLGNASPTLYGIVQEYRSDNILYGLDMQRPYGTIGNAGLFASYILFNISLVVYLALSIGNKIRRIIFIIIGFLLTASLIISGTRSAYLALAAFVVCWVFITWFFLASRKIKIFISGILMVLILVIGFIWSSKNDSWVKSNSILSRFTSISFEDISAKTRFWAWESSVQGLRERPILGWGPENFNIVFNKYFNPLHFQGYVSITWYDRAHNIFIDTASTMGIIGLLSYLSIFGAVYFLLLKSYHRFKENPAIFGLISTVPVAYFVQDILWFDDFSGYLMIFLFLAFSSNFFTVILNLDIKLDKVREFFKGIIIKYLNFKLSKNFLKENLFYVQSFLIFLILLIAYFGNIKPWIFNNKLSVVAGSFKGDGDRSFELYKAAMAESTYLGRYESYKQLADYVNNYYVHKKFITVKEQEFFRTNLDFTVSELKTAIADNPYDAQLYLLLGRLYNKYYDISLNPIYLDEAEKILLKGLDFSPEREAILYELGQTFSFKKDFPKAVEIFYRARDLNPDVPVSHWYLGVAYSNTKKFSEAKNEVEKAISLGYVYQNNIKEILLLTPIYAELKDYNTLEKLYNEALAQEPSNPEIHASLAVVYKEMGDKEKAKAMAEKAIALDPSYAAEGKAFIDSLN